MGPQKEARSIFLLCRNSAMFPWYVPFSFPAVLTTMQMLTPEAFTRLASLGQLARERITEEFRAAGIPGQVTGLGSLFRIHFTDRRFANYGDFYPLPVGEVHPRGSVGTCSNSASPGNCRSGPMEVSAPP